MILPSNLSRKILLAHYLQNIGYRFAWWAPYLRDEGLFVFWLVVGLAGLIISFRILVWGAVEIAHGFGVSDLIIGSIVAAGTSLPELASSSYCCSQGGA
jgi:hypothetical protein